MNYIEFMKILNRQTSLIKNRLNLDIIGLILLDKLE